MTKSIKAVLTATASVKKFSRIPNGETEPKTSRRLSLLETAKEELKKAQALETAKVGLVYELFHKGLEGRSQTTMGSHC